MLISSFLDVRVCRCGIELLNAFRLNGCLFRCGEWLFSNSLVLQNLMLPLCRGRVCFGSRLFLQRRCIRIRFDHAFLFPHPRFRSLLYFLLRGLYLIMTFLPVVAAFCMKHNEIYALHYEKLNSIYYSWKSMVDMYKQVNGKLSGVHCWFLPGLGCWMFYIGILLFVVAEAFRYVINTLNEDDA